MGAAGGCASRGKVEKIPYEDRRTERQPIRENTRLRQYHPKLDDMKRKKDFDC